MSFHSLLGSSFLYNLIVESKHYVFQFAFTKEPCQPAFSRILLVRAGICQVKLKISCMNAEDEIVGTVCGDLNSYLQQQTTITQCDWLQLANHSFQLEQRQQC